MNLIPNKFIRKLTTMVQIGFLTEWQLYAQKIEGDSWVGDKLDPEKVEKMSGLSTLSSGKRLSH